MKLCNIWNERTRPKHVVQWHAFTAYEGHSDSFRRTWRRLDRFKLHIYTKYWIPRIQSRSVEVRYRDVFAATTKAIAADYCIAGCFLLRLFIFWWLRWPSSNWSEYSTLLEIDHLQEWMGFFSITRRFRFSWCSSLKDDGYLQCVRVAGSRLCHVVDHLYSPVQN